MASEHAAKSGDLPIQKRLQLFSWMLVFLMLCVCLLGEVPGECTEDAD